MLGARQVGRPEMYNYNSPSQIKYPGQNAATNMPMSQASGVRSSPNPGGWAGTAGFQNQGGTDFSNNPASGFSQISPNSSSPAGPPTYTQLGSQNIPSSQPNNFPHSSPPSTNSQGMWPPHWQGGTAEAQQNTQGQQAPNGQQNEEFSDVFRMLDPPGQEFNDLSGMFNTFQD